MVDLSVRDAPERSRYEALADEQLAGFIRYEVSGETILLVHTEVLEGFAGSGAASQMVRLTLEDLLERERRVIVRCPFIRRWLTRHEDYGERVGRPAAGVESTGDPAGPPEASS